MKKLVMFDFSGSLVNMRPPKLLIKRSNLKRLARTFDLGIITGAKRSETLNILKKLRVSDLFNQIITSDDSKYKKPDPKLFPPRNIFAYIGDSPTDGVFAKNANVPFFRINKKYRIDVVVQKLLK